MNSQLLLFINFLLVVFLVLYIRGIGGFGGRRGESRGPRLNMRSKEQEIPPITAVSDTREVVESMPETSVAALSSIADLEKKTMLTYEPSDRDKKGVFFVYNAHEWESYEVLGLPIGAGLSAATERYQNLIKTSDVSTFEFYGAAFQAILKKDRGFSGQD